MNSRRKLSYLGLVPFLFLFIIYIAFLSPDIYGGDVGDLVTSSYVHGIAHPPGYPLFTFLGFFLIKFLFFLPPIVSVGVISATSSVLTVYIFYKFSKDISGSTVFSYISSFTVAFTYLFWLYSEVAEVFALNNLLSISFLYFSYLFYKTQKFKYFYLSLLFLGLGLSNHHMIIFLIPGAFIFYLSNIKKIFNLKVIFTSFVFFILGLSFYLYVPIAAAFNPPVNWNGDPTISNLFNLFTRKIYGTFQSTPLGSTSIEEKWVIFTQYFNSLFTSVTLPVFIIAFVGIITNLNKKNKRISLVILLSFLIAGPFFNVYAAFPLYSVFNISVAERFYILSSILLLLFLSLGIKAFSNLLKKIFSNPFYPKLIVYFLFFIPLFLFIKNYPKTNLSKLNIGSNYGINILKPLPLHSLVLLSGDAELFDTWYAYYVLGVRNDLKIAHWPGFIGSDYLMKIREEYNRQYKDKKQNEKLFWRFLMSKDTVYSVSPLSTSDDNLIWIPYGLLYKLSGKKNLPAPAKYLGENERIWNEMRIPSKDASLMAYEKNLTTLDTVSDYSKSLTNTGIFIFSQYKDYENSRKYLQDSLKINPQYSQTYAALSLVEHDSLKDCSLSFNLLQNAILLDPTNLVYYSYIPLIEKDCKNKIFDASFKNLFVQKFRISPDIFVKKKK